MAKIILEPGDICEVEDTEESGWRPISVDEFTVELVAWKGPMDFWEVKCPATGRTGLIRERYLHLKT